MSWYKKADTGADDYSTKVKVSMYGPSNYEVEGPDSVYVKFRIDVEAREWGIKNINLLVGGIIEVPYLLTEYDADDNESESQRSIEVDLAQVPKENKTGSGVITLDSLELWLDDSFNVDYNRSSLSLYGY